MRRFRDYKLGIKQGIIFAVILVLLGGAELFLMYRMTILKAQIDTITTKWLPSAVAGASIKSSASELRNMQLQQAIAQADSTKKRLAGVMIQLIDKIEANQDEYEKLVSAPEQLAIYGRFEDKWERYQELSFVFFSLVEKKKSREAVDLLTGEAEVAFNDFSAVLDTLVTANETAASDAAWQAEAMYNRALKLVGRGNFLAALDGLLEILRQDKRYYDGEVHQVVLGLFGILGNENPTTRQYRNELASILF